MDYITINNIDIQKIVEKARAQRSAALGAMIGNGIFIASVWLKKSTILIAAGILEAFSAFKRFNDAWSESAANKMRDDYFASSSNLADLEKRQQLWNQKQFKNFIYD